MPKSWLMHIWMVHMLCDWWSYQPLQNQTSWECNFLKSLYPNGHKNSLNFFSTFVPLYHKPDDTTNLAIWLGLFLKEFFWITRGFQENSLPTFFNFVRAKGLHQPHTNSDKWNRHLVCLWSKITIFQTNFLPLINAGLPMTTSIFNTTCESFQMRYCMLFYLKGHQIYQNSKLKLPKKSAFMK